MIGKPPRQPPAPAITPAKPDMYRLQTAILEHTTAAGVHHDWLIEDPRLPNPHAPDTKLWTARVTPPPHHWPGLKRFDLTVIPPHRRTY
ncbi:MAG: hypothetical protein AAF711_18975, partial [Planctomycetota bacterium]